MKPRRYRIWWLMVGVAIIAVAARCYLWLLPPQPNTHVLRSNYRVDLYVGGYTFTHTSPVFWLILPLMLAILISPLVALFMAVRWGIKVFRSKKWGHNAISKTRNRDTTQ